jgi:hypothetical protein
MPIYENEDLQTESENSFLKRLAWLAKEKELTGARINTWRARKKKGTLIHTPGSASTARGPYREASDRVVQMEPVWELSDLGNQQQTMLQILSTMVSDMKLDLIDACKAICISEPTVHTESFKGRSSPITKEKEARIRATFKRLPHWTYKQVAKYHNVGVSVVERVKNALEPIIRVETAAKMKGRSKGKHYVTKKGRKRSGIWVQ